MKNCYKNIYNDNILTKPSLGSICPYGFRIRYGSMPGDGFFDKSNEVTFGNDFTNLGKDEQTIIILMVIIIEKFFGWM